MQLNRLEKLMMNNPVRSALQRREADRLLQMGGAMDGGLALEVGCGRGVGTELILDVFRANRVDAFDLDPDMVARARRRLAGRGERVRIWTGDATAIDAEDERYDAVFDFAIIHHIPRWRDALAEIQRVLKPGGRFYSEGILERFIHHPVWGRLLDHPMEDRFDHDAFREGLEHSGLSLVDSVDQRGQMAFFVAEKP